MRKMLLAAVALGGLTALMASGAVAHPLAGGVHAVPAQPLVTHVDYYHNQHHYHHRRFDHGHWRYWD